MAIVPATRVYLWSMFLLAASGCKPEVWHLRLIPNTFHGAESIDDNDMPSLLGAQVLFKEHNSQARTLGHISDSSRSLTLALSEFRPGASIYFETSDQSHYFSSSWETLPELPPKNGDVVALEFEVFRLPKIDKPPASLEPLGKKNTGDLEVSEHALATTPQLTASLARLASPETAKQGESNSTSLEPPAQSMRSSWNTSSRAMNAYSNSPSQAQASRLDQRPAQQRLTQRFHEGYNERDSAKYHDLDGDLYTDLTSGLDRNFLPDREEREDREKVAASKTQPLKIANVADQPNQPFLGGKRQNKPSPLGQGFTVYLKNTEQSGLSEATLYWLNAPSKDTHTLCQSHSDGRCFFRLAQPLPKKLALLASTMHGERYLFISIIPKLHKTRSFTLKEHERPLVRTLSYQRGQLTPLASGLAYHGETLLGKTDSYGFFQPPPQADSLTVRVDQHLPEQHTLSLQEKALTADLGQPANRTHRPWREIHFFSMNPRPLQLLIHQAQVFSEQTIEAFKQQHSPESFLQTIRDLDAWTGSIWRNEKRRATQADKGEPRRGPTITVASELGQAQVQGESEANLHVQPLLYLDTNNRLWLQNTLSQDDGTVIAIDRREWPSHTNKPAQEALMARSRDALFAHLPIEGLRSLSAPNEPNQPSQPGEQNQTGKTPDPLDADSSRLVPEHVPAVDRLLMHADARWRTRTVLGAGAKSSLVTSGFRISQQAPMNPSLIEQRTLNLKDSSLSLLRLQTLPVQVRVQRKSALGIEDFGQTPWLALWPHDPASVGAVNQTFWLKAPKGYLSRWWQAGGEPQVRLHRDLIRQAETLFAASRPQKARDVLRTITQEHPDYVKGQFLWLELGLEAGQLRDAPSIMKHLENLAPLLKDSPRWTRPLQGLRVQALIHAGSHYLQNFAAKQHALKHYDEALRLTRQWVTSEQPTLSTKEQYLEALATHRKAQLTQSLQDFEDSKQLWKNYLDHHQLSQGKTTEELSSDSDSTYLQTRRLQSSSAMYKQTQRWIEKHQEMARKLSTPGEPARTF